MRIPIWVTLAVAAAVILLGAYRIKVALTPIDAEQAKKSRGIRGMSNRWNLVVGIIQILLGAGLVAVSFGWNPWADSVGPEPAKPAKVKTVPIEQLPKH